MRRKSSSHASKLIYLGAEAKLREKIYLGFRCIEKKRIFKKYRIAQINKKLLEERTKSEASIMKDASAIVKTPRIFSVDLKNMILLLEFIDGIKLIEYRKIPLLSRKIGSCVRMLHNQGIIHGDLTTSNMILKNGEIYFIDFGLALKSKQLEDIATDLLVFKKMLKSTHYNQFDEIWTGFLKGYSPNKKILKKIAQIEQRARYTERN